VGSIYMGLCDGWISLDAGWLYMNERTNEWDRSIGYDDVGYDFT
jgi:hypothetical protein